MLEIEKPRIDIIDTNEDDRFGVHYRPLERFWDYLGQLVAPRCTFLSAGNGNFG